MHFSSKSLANTLKDAGCQIFLNTLDKIDGAKDLILSSNILVQLDSICGMRKLRQNAVDRVFKLEPEPVTSETRNRVFVIRPWIDEVRLVANQINHYLTNGDDTTPSDIKFWIIFVPRLLHCCDLTLEEEGVYEYVSILECPLGLLPIEYDVYSLEDESIFKNLFLNKDTTPITDIVNSIVQLQLLSGHIVDVHGQGKVADKISKKLDEANIKFGHSPTKPRRNSFSCPDTIGRDSPAASSVLSGSDCNQQDQSSNQLMSPFTDIYLFDRDTDFASTLLSQLNYEGILDESFSICCNKLEFSSSKKANKLSDEPTKIRHSLTSESDPIFRDIRDIHFSTVFSLLKTKNREMKEKHNKSQDLNIANLKNFVANELKGLQTELKCLVLHIEACEEIMIQRNKYDFSDQLRKEQNIIDGIDIKDCLEYVSKMITHKLNPHVPLRLLSLLSLTQGGLIPRDYKKFHSLYCVNYGLYNNATFDNLKSLGLLTEMNLSLNALTGGLLNYTSSDSHTSKSMPPPQPLQLPNSSSSSLSLASFTGAMSSFTERATGRMAAVVSTSVLPRRGQLSIMMKKFQLVPEISEKGYNFREPKDPAFVFGGAYIPLVCQLVNNFVLSPPKKNSISMTPEVSKLLSGPTFKRKQASLQNLSSLVGSNQVIGGQLDQKTRDRCILVYFIGGVTFAEITALRFLARERQVKIAIATTSIINGNKLVESMYPSERLGYSN